MKANGIFYLLNLCLLNMTIYPMIGKTQEQKKVVFSVQGKEVAHVPMRIAENVFGYVKDWLADEKSEEDLVIKVDEFGPEAAQLLSEFIAMALVYTRYREGLKLSPVFQRLIAQYPTLDEYINTKIKKSPHLASLYYLTDFLNMQGSLADHLNTLVPYIIARDKTLFNDPNGFRLDKNKQTLSEGKLKNLQDDINIHRVFSDPLYFGDKWSADDTFFDKQLSPNRIAFDTTGVYGVIASYFGGLRIIDVPNIQLKAKLSLNNVVKKLAVGRHYALVICSDQIIVIEIPSGRIITTLNYQDSIDAALGNNEQYAMISLMNKVKIIEIPSGKELTTIDADVARVAIAKNSSYGIIDAMNFVKIIDVSTGEELIIIPQSFGARSVAISDDGKFAALGLINGVNIIDVLSKKVEFLPHKKYEYTRLALSGNGNYALRALADRVEIIEIPRGEVVASIKSNNLILSLAINKKGTIGVALYDKLTKIFEVPSGKILSIFPGHLGSSIVIDEEGNYILSDYMMMRIGLKDFNPEQAMAIAVVDALYNNGMLSQLEPSSYIYKQLKTLPGEAKDKLKEYYNLPLETIISRILRWFRR